MNTRKKKALECLIREPTKKEAARAAGIAESTMRLYFKDPEFVQAYNAALLELISDATNQAKQGLSPALKTLRDIVEDMDEKAGDRITAAKTILEYGLKLSEFVDVVHKVEELEEWRRSQGD